MYNLKYRPKNFKELVGNEQVVKNLINQFPEWPTTFLLIGPPGVGKTTLARVIAKQLECETINLVEVDAGQDRGIDKIRELVKRAYERPLVGKSKVFILDEAQGLTAEAQQALLKVTEETPASTYFIFCSTDPSKIIKALRERCKFGEIELKPLEFNELAIILKSIIAAEEINITDLQREIAKLCIKNSDGIPRRAIMMFERFKDHTDLEFVKKEIEYNPEGLEEEFIPMIVALENNDIAEFCKIAFAYEGKTGSVYKGKWETLRIKLGHTFKKKLYYAIINNNKEKTKQCYKLLDIFAESVDNTHGDVQLLHRIGMLERPV